jgi:hypothetical protein
VRETTGELLDAGALQPELCVHFAYLGMFDGHGGRVAAQMCAKQLLSDCLLPALDAAALADGGAALTAAVAAGGHSLDAWWALHAPAALFAAFVAMDALVSEDGLPACSLEFRTLETQWESCRESTR